MSLLSPVVALSICIESVIALGGGGGGISRIPIVFLFECGSCGCTLTVCVLITAFFNASTLTNTRFEHNLDARIDWSRILAKSYAINGLMFRPVVSETSLTFINSASVMMA